MNVEELEQALKERGVDPAQIEGSGADGNVIKKDLERAFNNLPEDKGVEIGTIVSYNDGVSGKPRDARVAGIGKDGVLDLAVFNSSGARPVPGIPHGRGPRTWKEKA